MRTRHLAVAAVLLLGPCVQARGSDASRGRATYFVRLERGSYELHGESGTARAAKVGRSFSWISPSIGLTSGSGDWNFSALDTELDVGPLLSYRDLQARPFVTVALPLMSEDEFGGFAPGIGVGAEIGFRYLALRASIRRSEHDGEPGPHLVSIGVALRLWTRAVQSKPAAKREDRRDRMLPCEDQFDCVEGGTCFEGFCRR